MLLHSCASVHSTETAIALFETVLGLSLSYTFDIDPDVMRHLFDQDFPVHVRVYDAGNCLIEVFISPCLPSPGAIQHLCFDCDDREAVAKRAQDLGMSIRRYERPKGDIIFIQDTDGNLIELKEVSGRKN